VVGGKKIQGRGGGSTLALVRQRQYTCIAEAAKQLFDIIILEFGTSEDHICWLFRHHTASIDAVPPPQGGGANAPLLFSEKAVNIINTYTFVLGAAYFSPPDFLHASSTTILSKIPIGSPVMEYGGVSSAEVICNKG